MIKVPFILYKTIQFNLSQHNFLNKNADKNQKNKQILSGHILM